MTPEFTQFWWAHRLPLLWILPFPGVLPSFLWSVGSLSSSEVGEWEGLLVSAKFKPPYSSALLVWLDFQGDWLTGF